MSRLSGLGNARLLIDLKNLVKRDRILEAELISHLGEVEARRLHLEQGCSSMFDYCVKELRFSESVAYKRIGVARVARKFPIVAEAISQGELHLSAASLIVPHLSEDNVAGWLKEVRHKKSREVRQLVADRFPREAVRSSVRRVKSVSLLDGLEGVDRIRRGTRANSGLRSTGFESFRPVDPPQLVEPSSSSASAPVPTPLTPQSLVDPEAHPPIVTTLSTCGEATARGSTEALGGQRFSVRFTADEKVHDQLQELRSLLRHSVPDGDVGKILARAIGVFLKQVRSRKIGDCASPRSRRSMQPSKTQSTPTTPTKPTRHIPVAIRREVWTRDKGQCTFESRGGRSCESREAIEFHHRVPWARCNEHTVDNIALRCRSHNQYEAVLDFGTEQMGRYRREGSMTESRRETDPRPETGSSANGDPDQQLDSDPVESRLLFAANPLNEAPPIVSEDHSAV